MRHYTAYLLARQPGVTVTDVQSILGHSNAAMSYFYSHAHLGQQSAALRRVGEDIIQSRSSGSE